MDRNISIYMNKSMSLLGFPDSSVGKKSTCNAGDRGSIPGLGRFPRERKSYPLQYSGLDNSMDGISHGVAKNQTQLSDFHFHFTFTLGLPSQLTVKNLPVMQKTWVQFWGWEDPLEKKIATHSSILAWRIPWAEELGRLQSEGSQESDLTQGLNHHHYEFITMFHIVMNHFIIFKMVKVLSGKTNTKMLSLLLKFFILKCPLEESMATHSGILAWRIPMHRGA